MPEIIPIKIEILKPRKIFSKDKLIEKSKKLVIKLVNIKTKIKPKIPPIKHKKTDSIKKLI